MSKLRDNHDLIDEAVNLIRASYPADSNDLRKRILAERILDAVDRHLAQGGPATTAADVLGTPCPNHRCRAAAGVMCFQGNGMICMVRLREAEAHAAPPDSREPVPAGTFEREMATAADWLPGQHPCKHPPDDHTGEGCRAHVKEPALPGGWDFCGCNSVTGERCGVRHPGGPPTAGGGK